LRLPWFYAPGSGRNFLDRFNTRGEAEAYRQRFLKRVGAEYQAVVCFDSPELLRTSEKPLVSPMEQTR